MRQLPHGQGKFIWPARNTDPLTSHQAAAWIVPQLPVREAEVLAVLRAVSPLGLTTAEIGRYLGRRDGSVTPRMAPLERKGLIVRSGTRVPKGGRKAQAIWYAVAL